MVWNVPFPQFYGNWEKNLQEPGFDLLGIEGNIFRKKSYGSLNPPNQLCFSQEGTEKFKASDSSVQWALPTSASFARWRSWVQPNTSCHCRTWSVCSCRTVSFSSSHSHSINSPSCAIKNPKLLELSCFWIFFFRFCSFAGRQSCLHKIMGYLLHLSSWGMNGNRTKSICWASEGQLC